MPSWRRAATRCWRPDENARAQRGIGRGAEFLYRDAMTTQADNDNWDAPPAEEGGTTLHLDLAGYDGPLDVLLALAREQKVDLLKISMVELVDQYLGFIATARRLRLEIAADYLVMAAWLAYLKSRLLLPPDPEEEEPSGEMMAEALAFQLRRLEAMRDAGEKLFELPLLGREVFGRGAPEGIPVHREPVYETSLYELLQAYADQKLRVDSRVLEIEPSAYFSLDDAVGRLRSLMGEVPDWTDLMRFLPEDLRDPDLVRSAVATTFAASLQLAKEGLARLQQARNFGPIHIRRADPEE
jgi:segregation and condensation protein A